MPIQDRVHGAASREVPVRVPARQDLEELRGAPAVPLPQRQNPLARYAPGSDWADLGASSSRSTTAFRPSRSIRPTHLYPVGREI